MNVGDIVKIEEEVFEEEEEEELRESFEEEELEVVPITIEEPENTGDCILLAVIYDGSVGKALCKLYDPMSKKIYYWHDKSGHMPYCLTDLTPEQVKRHTVVTHKGFRSVVEVEKYDLIRDKFVKLSKIIASDPLAIGGRRKSIREILPKAWEDRIPYNNCYIYDKGLIPGLYYRVVNGQLKPVEYNLPIDVFNQIIKLFENEPVEVLDCVKEWLPLFLIPVPDIPRLAIDIEVLSTADRIPEPSKAEDQVICVSCVSSDNLKRVFMLKREGVKSGIKPSYLGEDIEFIFYDDEAKMLLDVFKLIMSYPIIVTFNGDDFDLNYLRHRASRIGIKRENIPLAMGRNYVDVVPGIHIDLYKFFSNRSIQVYAFGNKYKDTTLDVIATAILGIGKITLDRTISELSYYDLAAYCFRDAEITLKLTTFNDGIVMKLILLLMRISKLGMGDVVRRGVSVWIRNMLYYEHRKHNYLIPSKEDIIASKGLSVTRALIKGKKYMGAIVIEPKPGVYFDVTVLDFASLYPSILYRWNLSYETINCPHKECMNNKIPELPHWVCGKRRGTSSIIIGILRNLRVYWFKPKTKDKSLSSDVRAWYSVVDQGLKVFLNASYGVMGDENFPLYCPPVAESITAVGRHVISKSIEKARDLGVEVVYGDTDSIFLYKPSQDQVKKLIEWSIKEFKIDLDVDKVYRYVTFSGLKKNYLGVLTDGSVDIKGLVGKKRNTPEFLKKLFIEVVNVLSNVQTIRDFEEAKYKISSIVRDYYIKLKNRGLNLDDLAFRVKLSKDLDKYVKTTPQHVKAAKLLEKFHSRKLGAGDIISYVKVKGDIGVKPVQLARIDEIDVEKYVGHMETTLRQILEAIGVNLNEIFGIRNLDKFFFKK
ncbi:MAG: DNA-directed DNA polymerase I [Candidatus Methanomethylicia archaeon]|nr:DNA-directed DNA polymerase I [Candidatus Methanomethylicia archaeon]MCX8168883.1 DNA-directed DNA polymerase I [Candidatus Methanomethylicia archaeon]MDW7988615.1 DNA-directed DNA polymerase I [Nitrososphaerota archaeon]